MYDLVIKGGKVIDPAQGISNILDVGVLGGRISALASEIQEESATEVIDARGMLVTPGLIDMHVHVAKGIMPIAVSPDMAGVLTGVTTVCDAGSTGYATFNGFKELLISQAKTDVLCLLYLSPVGQAVYPEIGWADVDADRMLKLVDEHRDTIRGFKLRASTAVVEGPGIELIKTLKAIGHDAGLPVEVHIGIDRGSMVPPDVLASFTRGMLNLLDEGDILAHVYTHRPGGVFKPDGSLLSEFEEAVARGVVLDVAPAASHLSFALARRALDQGILPTTISTDITNTNCNGPVMFSLPVVMSEFLALGLSLEQVIKRTTINPAMVLGEAERRGSLREGMTADVTLLELQDGDFVFGDGTAGNSLNGEHLLVPRLTLKRGETIPTEPRFRNYVPGEPLTLVSGT